MNEQTRMSLVLTNSEVKFAPKRTGVFAVSPDPIVFGPDRFASPDTSYTFLLAKEYKDCFYYDLYIRSDYPDFSW